MHERVTGTTALQFFAAIDKAIDEAGSGQYRAFKLVAELDGMGLEIIAKDLPPSRGVGTEGKTDSAQGAASPEPASH